MEIDSGKLSKGAKRAYRMEKFVTGLLRGIDRLIPAPPSFKTEQGERPCERPDVLRGFDSEPGEAWHLGYSSRSITPQDVLTKKYFVGGNLSVPPRRFKSVTDDIRVRVIALSDGDGREKEVFCTADCIGLTNFTVNTIREELRDFAHRENIACINVLSTHAHSSVDTMGVWSVTAGRFFKNLCALWFGKKDPSPSVDGEFTDLLVKNVKLAVEEAVADMTPGKLYLAQMGFDSVERMDDFLKDKIGFVPGRDEWDAQWQQLLERERESLPLSQYGLRDFLFAKRHPKDYSPRMNRLRFEPADKSRRGTLIVNFGAHPYANGLKIGKHGSGDGLSADFPYYMDELISAQGSNFIFFNGAVNGIYPNRGAGVPEDSPGVERFTDQTRLLGHELARLTLAMTRTQGEIQDDPVTATDGRGRAYRDAVRRMGADPIPERELAPQLAAAHGQVLLEAQNPLERIIGKLGFARFKIEVGDRKRLYVKTETGILVLGGEFRITLIPGEATPGFVTGTGDMVGEKTLCGQDPDFACVQQAVGGDTAVFGLANDALGYIIPDNDYCMFFMGYGKLPQKLFMPGYGHYQEMFSLGRNTASVFSGRLRELAQQAVMAKDSAQV